MLFRSATGTYSLTARAVDAGGLTTNSAAAALTVTAVANNAPVAVNLAGAFNVYGIFNDATTITNGGLDTTGSAYSANLLGQSVTGLGVSFNLGIPGAPNAVANASISLPAGNFTSLKFLATGLNGNQANQAFVVAYTDGTSTSFTQSVSDWFTPQAYSGETRVSTMAYRLVDTGILDNRTFYLYGYTLALNSAKTVRSITLPNNRNVTVLAITLSPALAAAPDFALTATPATLSVVQGGRGTSQIAVSAQNGFTGAVAFTVSGLPLGVTSTFNAATLTLTADANAPAGASTITITGTSGTLAHSTSVALTVTAPTTVPTTFTSTIVNVLSGRCITISAASTADAADALQQTCGTATNQQFRFNLVVGSADVYTMTAVHSNKLLDVYGGSTAAGTRLIQWPSNGGANQHFRLTKQTDGSYYLTAMHSNLRVGVRSNSTSNNATVEQQNNSTSTTQRWRIPGRP